MRPLTDHTPKPLLRVGGKPLIVWHLEKLAAIGVNYVVVNTSHLADQFPEALGDGARWGLRIRYAYEGHTPLETGGGMLNAQALLGPEPFLAINGDIWSDIDLATLPHAPRAAAHLVLVDNPQHHPDGDFVLDAHGQLHGKGEQRLTFAGIGVYRANILDGWPSLIDPATQPGSVPRFPLAPLLRTAMASGTVDGMHHRGAWTDVGTPDRLARLDSQLHQR